ncbi:hypothetical protein F2Q70_00004285 [Brassica cretica]|uniref:Uncharacterized protein n=1 Tax=Brassica cretica TaxID=69181 RepID=A0A8S9IPD9_BRACR|nr:hypothetical protein F2Q70_00004285 [Brassica cretica]
MSSGHRSEKMRSRDEKPPWLVSPKKQNEKIQAGHPIIPHPALAQYHRGQARGQASTLASLLGNDQMDEVRAKLDSVHKLLMKLACLVEDAEAVDTEGRAEVEEDVNFIGGTGFQSGEAGEAARRRFRSREFDEFRRIALVSINTRSRTSIDGRQPKLIDSLSRASIDDTYGVDRILRCREDHYSRERDRHRSTERDRHRSTTSSAHQSTHTSHILSALRPQPKPSSNPLETTSTHSDDAAETMEVDKAPMGRTLRKRNEKVAKHLKRGANEKEMESFQKRVFMIPLEKSFKDPILVIKPKMSSRRIDDSAHIASCHCGAEYETEYSGSIETHTATSIDSAPQKSIDIHKEESIDSGPGDWENDYYNPTMAMYTPTLHTEEYDEDYEEERAIEYRAILVEEDRLLHHSSWKRNATSIDSTVPTSVGTEICTVDFL